MAKDGFQEEGGEGWKDQLGDYKHPLVTGDRSQDLSRTVEMEREGVRDERNAINREEKENHN